VPVTEREIKREMDTISSNPTREIDPIVVRASAEAAHGWDMDMISSGYV
jgi:hypothetical protein